MFASVASDKCAVTPPGSQCGPPFDEGTFQYWDDDLSEKKAYFGVDSIPTHIYFWDHGAIDTLWGHWFPAQTSFLNNIASYQALGNPSRPTSSTTCTASERPVRRTR